MKKAWLICVIILCLCSFSKVYAQDKIKVYIFVKENETISDNAYSYINSLKEEYDFDVTKIIVWDTNWKEDIPNRKLADSIAKHFNKTVLGAPIIVIGDYYFDEFNDDIKKEIKIAIENECSNSEYKDIVKQIKIELNKDTKESNMWSYIILSVMSIGVVSLIIISRKSLNK